MSGQPSKKTIAKYMEMCAAAGRVWTEGEIVSFRSLINTKLSNAPDVRDALLERFNASLDIVPFQLEQQQQQKGLQWLLDTQVNSKGVLRQANTTFIVEFELAVLREFASMELVGLRDVARAASSAYRAFTPVYRVKGISGAAFGYSLNSYGAFEVTRQVLNCIKLKRTSVEVVYTV